MLLSIDLLSYQDQLRSKREGAKRYIFDPIRKKWLVLQPEEIVRQLVVLYLMRKKAYKPTHMHLEMGLKVNQMSKRCDIITYNRAVEPFLLVECKSPSVMLNQDTFRQIANYNLPLRVPYLMITNGPDTACCRMDYEQESFTFLSDIPTSPF